MCCVAKWAGSATSQRRITGELAKLGVRVSARSVRTILRRDGTGQARNLFLAMAERESSAQDAPVRL